MMASCATGILKKSVVIFTSIIGILCIAAFVRQGYLFQNAAVSNTFTSFVVASAIVAAIGIYLQQRLLLIPLFIALATWFIAIAISLGIVISSHTGAEESPEFGSDIAHLGVFAVCAVITNVLIVLLYRQWED